MKEIEERRRAARRAGKSGDNIDNAEWEDVDEHERKYSKTQEATLMFQIPMLKFLLLISRSSSNWKRNRKFSKTLQKPQMQVMVLRTSLL